MNLYTSLTLRYLKENKKRTIVTIIGIILSTALICGIGNIYSSFMDYEIRETIQRDGSFYATFNNVDKDKIDYITKSAGISNSGISKEFGYANSGEGNLLKVLGYDNATFNNVDKDKIDYITKSAGISNSGISKEFGYANSGEGNLLKVLGYDKNYFEGFNISLKEGDFPKNKNEIVISENSNLITDSKFKIGDNISLKEGDFPKNKNEIVISENSNLITDSKFKIGDNIKLSIGKRLSEEEDYLDSPTVQENEKLVDTKEETFKVVGIINKPGFEYSNGIQTAITYIDNYLDSPTVQENEKLVDTKEETFKVVGIINKPGFEYSNGIQTAITYIDKSLVNNNDKVNISVNVNNPKDIYSIVSSICKNGNLEKKIDSNGEKVDNVDYNEHLLRLKGASAYANINNSIGYIVLLVGSLVVICTIATVYNSFSISISERKKQFGILNSIGATNSQIMKLVFLEGFIVSIVATIGATNSQIMKLVFLEGFIVSIVAIPIGLLSGTLAMDIVFKIIQKFYSNSLIGEMNLKVVYNPVVIIFSIIVVLITIFISVIIPARVASKVSPLDAIKNSSDYKVGKVKDSKLVRLIFKTEGVLAYKNLRRNKKKFRITLFSLVISVVIFIAFSGFMTLFLKAEDVRVGQMNYDMCLYGNRGDSIKKSKELVNEINKIDGVKNISFSNTHNLLMDLEENRVNKSAKEKVQSYFIREKENNKTVYRLNNGLNLPGYRAIENIKLTEGSFDKESAIKENGVILINKSYYEEKGKKGVLDMTNYKVGDTIEVYSMGYDEKSGKEYIEKTYKFKIMGISEDILIGDNTYPYMGIGMVTYDEVAKNNGFDTASNFIYIESDLKESTKKSIKNLAEKYKFSVIDEVTYDEVAKNNGFDTASNFIYIESDLKESTKKSIKNLAEKYKFSVIDEVEEYQAMQDSMKVMQIFVYGFVTVISLVSVTNIINTISTNINLRKKELAIIKSIGVTPSGFNKMIYLESFLYGALALLWGIPIGILLTILMNTILGDVISFGLVLPYNAILICIVAIFIIYNTYEYYIR